MKNYNFKVVKAGKLLFKNKELSFRLLKSVGKSFKKIGNVYNPYSKIYWKAPNVDFLRTSKGHSLYNYKRKAFYSKFQLSRFDIKSLTSYKFITGLQSFYW